MVSPLRAKTANLTELGILLAISNPSSPIRGNLACDNESAKCCSVGLRLYAASCRLWRAKTPNSTIQHCVVSPSIAYSGSETKLSAGAQLQTFTYSTIQNRFLNANGLMAIAQILPLKSVTVKKTIENSRRGNRGSPYRFCFWSLSDPIYSFAIIKGAENIGQTHLRGKAVVRPA